VRFDSISGGGGVLVLQIKSHEALQGRQMLWSEFDGLAQRAARFLLFVLPKEQRAHQGVDLRVLRRGFRQSAIDRKVARASSRLP
jgi:hypothetical protein